MPPRNREAAVGAAAPASVGFSSGAGILPAFAGRQEHVGLHAVLARVEVVIAPLQGVQRFVRAALHDAALFHDQDLIGAPNGGKTVRDHERGAPLHQVCKPFLNGRFRFRIQAGSGFVQNQNARIGQNGARNRDALPLPARELHAPLAHDGVVFHLEVFGELVHARDAAGGHDLLFGGGGPGERDILANVPSNRNVS